MAGNFGADDLLGVSMNEDGVFHALLACFCHHVAEGDNAVSGLVNRLVFGRNRLLATLTFKSPVEFLAELDQVTQPTPEFSALISAGRPVDHGLT